MMQGGNLFFQGEFARAQDHAEQGLTLYDPLQHRALIFLYGDDPQVLCHCWAALALWYLGHPNQAMERINEALRIAEDLSYPFGLAFARFWTVFLHQSRRELQRTQEQTEALVTFAQAQGIPQFASMGTILRGWALAKQGHEGEGIAQIRQGMAGLRTVGQELGRPYFSALLAEAYRQGGQVAEGLNVLTEALAITHKTGECMHQAELYRLQGELLSSDERGTRNDERKTHKKAQSASSIHRSAFRTYHSVEAEACFQKAVEIARRQSAKSLELRAAMSLSRLWQRQGKAKQAHKMLAGIYSWFTEGLDTKDLQEAKALLAELEAGSA